MLAYRYLVKEVFTTMCVITFIILLVFLSNQLVQYLGRAAGGQFSQWAVFQLMLLEVPNLMTLLLPLCFYMGIIIGLGRLHTDSEMLSLSAAGVGQTTVLATMLSMALVIAVIVGSLSFYVNPKIFDARNRLIKTKGIATYIKTIMPRRFKPLSGDSKVLYIENVNSQHSKAEGLFLAEQMEDLKQWKIIVAKRGQTKMDDRGQIESLLLNQGKVYQGEPGHGEHKLFEFKKMTMPIPVPTLMRKNDPRTLSLTQLLLLPEDSLVRIAELQWRISMPLVVMVLTVIAVPLSRCSVRQGKFSLLLPAIIIYAIYANLLFMSRAWILHDKISPVWGMWWLHAVMMVFGIGLFKYYRR